MVIVELKVSIVPKLISEWTQREFVPKVYQLVVLLGLLPFLMIFSIQSSYRRAPLGGGQVTMRRRLQEKKNDRDF